MVGTGGVDAVLVGDDFPELGSDLVTTLTGLDVNDFSHFSNRFFFSSFFKNQVFANVCECNEKNY